VSADEASWPAWLRHAMRDPVVLATAWLLDNVPMPDACWSALCTMQNWRFLSAYRREMEERGIAPLL